MLPVDAWASPLGEASYAGRGRIRTEESCLPSELPENRTIARDLGPSAIPLGPVILKTPIEWKIAMSDHVYKKIELIGSSPNSIEEAIENAVHTAGQSVRNLRWFEVMETRGHIEDGKIAHYQVTIKVGFTIERPA